MSSTPTPEPTEPDDGQEPEDATALETLGAEPVPFMKGKFALYQTPGGGIHLTYWTEKTGEVHQDFPARLIKMMTGGRLSKMFGL